MELEAFWRNHVLARVEPPLVEKPDAVLESLRRLFRARPISLSRVLIWTASSLAA